MREFNLPRVRGSYRFNVNLAKTTWFGVGGAANILFRPADIDDLIFFLKNCDNDLPITVLGVGSNIIIRDGGIEGVVIKLGKEFTNITKYKDDSITVGAGSLCANVALYSKMNGLGGLEFLSTIPGTIGGGLAMNAGCYGGDMSQILIEAQAVDFSGNLTTLTNQDFGFKYRGNNLDKNLIFLCASLRTYLSDSMTVGAKIAEFIKRREESQPIRTKTGGSTFKNPVNSEYSAWQLIDMAGCRGLKIGDAKISEKHCNFMINAGNARASDLIDLGNKVIDLVREKTGVTLEWEVKIIGRD